jgi:hypothetical protein
VPLAPIPLRKKWRFPSAKCKMLFELVKLTMVLVPLVVPDELPLVDIEDEDVGVVVAELGVVVAELGVERTNVLDIVAPA